jgi:transcriptional regulator with XRE-family HTH domain
MEMIINAEKVIAERKIRAWSQQHLADASAVSLRTIQRVENNGSGSLETIKALASCFELDVDMLFEPKIEVINKNQKSKAKTKPQIVALCSFILALLSSVLFIVPTSMASNITINAENIKTNSHEGYSIYTNNVVIFLPKGMPHKVLIDSNWEADSSSSSSGGIKIYLDHSIISIDKASITTTESGTKITTEYAKFSKSE